MAGTGHPGGAAGVPIEGCAPWSHPRVREVSGCRRHPRGHPTPGTATRLTRANSVARRSASRPPGRPATLFVTPSLGVLVARPGMTDCPCR